MPSLTWNETRDRALKFSRAWASARHEEQDKQTFWNEFFECYGIPRKSVAVFEHAVSNLKGNYGFLDLFWPGVLLVEHKSRGASLDKAESQAFRYLEDLAREGRHDEMPRYIVLCDFLRFAIYDLEPGAQKDLSILDDGRHFRLVEFSLHELHKHVREFAFVKGEKTVRLDPEDPANLKATQLLADLHDALESTGFVGHALERMLVRLLFCLFAEDTGIFDAPGSFTAVIERTRGDGSDLGPQLAQLFQVLNQPPDKRQNGLDEDLAAFPYVNGGLFAESLPIVVFTTAHRDALLSCCRFHWAKISPAVFGSLFQGIMDKKERRQAGAHYTSEQDIMKLIRSLFLDELRASLDAALADRSTGRKKRLQEFQKTLRSLKFFDPACGCGNFLILAYRELRRLEMAALVALNTNPEGKVQADLLDIRDLAQVDVDQFYGIEIGEWAARIAEVGLWLTDHQCNMELAEALGRSFRRLPLKASPTLKVANSLRMDWNNILASSECSYILGNPPFVGKHLMTAEQSQDMELVWGETAGAGVLDYVTAWYRKAAEYSKGTSIRVGFVSTNSISQGEQVGPLWNSLFRQFGLKIHFAHRTFAWESEARGKAHVHVVIVGFGAFDIPNKRIFDYHEKSATISNVKNISPYLVEGSDLAVVSRSTPISNVPECIYGNKPTDGGHLIVEEADRENFLTENPGAKKYIRPLLCAEEYLHATPRWCLWLVDASPADIRTIAGIKQRVEATRDFRLASKKLSTREKASQATLFAEIRQPTSRYIVIPQHTSENRKYVPFGYFDPEVIIHNSCSAIPDATSYHFGILSSAMHMAWVRQVCGRLESRYRYSTSLVYNNYPWPEAPTDKQRAAVAERGQAVLDARNKYPDNSLADLYDPLAMPAELVKAHAELDREVDGCYRKEPFASDRERFMELIALYERLSNPLLTVPGVRRKKVGKNST